MKHMDQKLRRLPGSSLVTNPTGQCQSWNRIGGARPAGTRSAGLGAWHSGEIGLAAIAIYLHALTYTARRTLGVCIPNGHDSTWTSRTDVMGSAGCLSHFRPHH